MEVAVAGRAAVEMAVMTVDDKKSNPSQAPCHRSTIPTYTHCYKDRHRGHGPHAIIRQRSTSLCSRDTTPLPERSLSGGLDCISSTAVTEACAHGAFLDCNAQPAYITILLQHTNHDSLINVIMTVVKNKYEMRRIRKKR